MGSLLESPFIVLRFASRNHIYIFSSEVRIVACPIEVMFTSSAVPWFTSSILSSALMLSALIKRVLLLIIFNHLSKLSRSMLRLISPAFAMVRSVVAESVTLTGECSLMGLMVKKRPASLPPLAGLFLTIKPVFTNEYFKLACCHLCLLLS